MFRGKYDFLSNMYPSPMVIGGIKYLCVEAAFQSMKLITKEDRKQFEGIHGAYAKLLGRKVTLRSDWNKIRINVMRYVVREKFKQNPLLKKRLLETGDMELVEENNWNDKFWGVCNGVGENWLGKILMEVRDEISHSEKTVQKENS